MKSMMKGNNFMRIADNSKVYMEEVGGMNSILQHVVNKSISDLAKRNIFVFPPNIDEMNNLTMEQKIVERREECLYTGNIMGCIGNKDEHLMIHSRFDRTKNKDYFLYYMLKKVLNFNLIDMEINFKNENGFLNLLIYLFPKYLNEALRKGLYKEYRTFEHNDLSLTGVVDIKRHLKKNTPFTGRIAYKTREHSFENHVIYLIRYTIEQLKTSERTKKLLSLDANMRRNVQAIENASKEYRKINIKKVIHKNKQKAVCHGYFYEYRNLQKLCLAILEYETGVFVEKSEQKIFGVLFDGAWLFEEYIHLLIEEWFMHPQNKRKLNGQQLFNDDASTIYPDFISWDFKEPIIADAKYKPVNNIGNKDYLQLLAYMYRFNSKTGYYFYPENNYSTDRQEFVLRQGVDFGGKNVKKRGGSKIRVIKHGLTIPTSAKNFEEFERNIRNSEKLFRLSLFEEE